MGANALLLGLEADALLADKAHGQRRDRPARDRLPDTRLDSAMAQRGLLNETDRNRGVAAPTAPRLRIRSRQLESWLSLPGANVFGAHLWFSIFRSGRSEFARRKLL